MSKLHISMNYCFRVVILSMFPLSAYAHVGSESLMGLANGFMHPFMGIDHLLVMLAIGLWASVLGGYRLWLLPLVFLSAMFIGAMLSFNGFVINGMEVWVAFSVLAVGLVLRQNKEVSAVVACSLISVFAMAHGYVHAQEIGNGLSAEAYAVGFLMATAILHLIGISARLFGLVTLKKIKNMYGLICALTGMAILVGS